MILDLVFLLQIPMMLGNKPIGLDRYAQNTVRPIIQTNTVAQFIQKDVVNI